MPKKIIKTEPVIEETAMSVEASKKYIVNGTVTAQINHDGKVYLAGEEIPYIEPLYLNGSIKEA